VPPPSVFDWTIGIDLSIRWNDNPKFGAVVAAM
jgi:hypothetical protein